MFCYVMNVAVGELEFGQLSLNFRHCAAPQPYIEPRYPGSHLTPQSFAMSPAARYTTVIPENWSRDATSKARFTDGLCVGVVRRDRGKWLRANLMHLLWVNWLKYLLSSILTFRHRESSIYDRRFATLQRTLFIYLINKYIYLSDICLTVHHWYK